MPSVKNVFKNAIGVIESLTDNHKNPLHVGKTMSCWTYFSFVSTIIIHVEIGLNTTSDTKLKKLLQESHKLMKSHKKEISELMHQEGVPLSDASEDKPESDPNVIPLEAKLTDNELANTINMNFVIAADMCAAAASQSLRTDVTSYS